MGSNSLDGALLSPEPTMFGTVSGLYVDVLTPLPEQINLFDIGHHQSVINRYGGATFAPWSVCAHSMLVSHLTMHVLDMDGMYPDMSDSEKRKITLHSLFHDAAEAYLNDVVSPVKYSMRRASVTAESEYDGMERTMNAAVCESLGLEVELLEHPAIKLADIWALKHEADRLMYHGSKTWRWPGVLPSEGDECAEVLITDLVNLSPVDVYGVWIDCVKLWAHNDQDFEAVVEKHREQYNERMARRVSEYAQSASQAWVRAFLRYFGIPRSEDE